EVPVNGEFNVNSFSNLGQIVLSGASLDVSGDPSGSVVIRGGRLSADGSQMNAITVDRDAPVAVDVQLADNISLTGGTAILSETMGTGRAGDIVLKAGSLGMQTSSGIATINDGEGTPGNISINVGSLSMTEEGPFINTLAAGNGRAGNISVDAGTLTMKDASVIGSDTFGAGKAGDVEV